MRTIKTHPWSLLNLAIVAFNLGLAVAFSSLLNLAIAVVVSLVVIWTWRTENRIAELRAKTRETWARVAALNAETAAIHARMARRQAGERL